MSDFIENLAEKVAKSYVKSKHNQLIRSARAHERKNKYVNKTTYGKIAPNGCTWSIPVYGELHIQKDAYEEMKKNGDLEKFFDTIRDATEKSTGFPATLSKRYLEDMYFDSGLNAYANAVPSFKITEFDPSESARVAYTYMQDNPRITLNVEDTKALTADIQTAIQPFLDKYGQNAISLYDLSYSLFCVNYIAKKDQGYSKDATENAVTKIKMKGNRPYFTMGDPRYESSEMSCSEKTHFYANGMVHLDVKIDEDTFRKMLGNGDIYKIYDQAADAVRDLTGKPAMVNNLGFRDVLSIGVAPMRSRRERYEISFLPIWMDTSDFIEKKLDANGKVVLNECLNTPDGELKPDISEKVDTAIRKALAPMVEKYGKDKFSIERADLELSSCFYDRDQYQREQALSKE